MKGVNFLLSASILALASCSQSTRTTDGADASKDPVNNQSVQKSLSAKMSINSIIKTGDPVTLKFTVFNDSDSTLQFCKWHTPFEPLMSKYLEIKDENGVEVAYQGPMAKRVMPPPATSYAKVNPKETLSADVDLLKGYAIKNPAKYTIVYTEQGISGLIVKDSVSFTYK